MTGADLPKYVATIFDPAGQRVVVQFDMLSDAVRWTRGLERAAARAEITMHGAIVWARGSSVPFAGKTAAKTLDGNR